MAHLGPVREPDPKRFTARLVVLEEPEVAEKIARMARENAHSLAAEVRGAIRYWIDAWDKNDD